MSVRESAIALLTDWDTPDSDQDALRHAVLAFLHARPDSCRRACAAGHITASTLVVDDTAQKVLLTLHPRFGRWLQLGGHCEDTDVDIFGAALREATEESGITDLYLNPNLAAVHVHSVTCSLGVPTRHLDLQFIATAAPGAEIAISDESLDLRWWPIDQLPDGTDAGLIRLVDAARRRWSSESRNPG
jgi:8-oxo-dGTP pyrophosphatase MutT (NUDIX family)